MIQPPPPDVPFAFLNGLHRGLGDVTLTYINTGEHDEVLQQIAGAAANLPKHLDGPSRKAIEKLVWQFREQPEALWRYAQVVRRLNLTDQRPGRKLPHRAHVREAVVQFLDWTVEAAKGTPDDKSTTVADLLYVVERLGGNAADLVSFSIPIARDYTQRRFQMVGSKKGWETLPVTAFSEALSKCDAKTRAIAFRSFKSMPLLISTQK